MRMRGVAMGNILTISLIRSLTPKLPQLASARQPSHVRTLLVANRCTQQSQHIKSCCGQRASYSKIDEENSDLMVGCIDTRLRSLDMQLTSSPFLSRYHIRQWSLQIVCKTRRHQPAPRAQLPAYLDEALSAKRINKQQIRALCELQQVQASAALALQQKDAQIQLENRSNVDRQICQAAVCPRAPECQGSDRVVSRREFVQILHWHRSKPG